MHQPQSASLQDCGDEIVDTPDATPHSSGNTMWPYISCTILVVQRAAPASPECALSCGSDTTAADDIRVDSVSNILYGSRQAVESAIRAGDHLHLCGWWRTYCYDGCL